VTTTKEKIKDVTKLVKSFSDVGCDLSGSVKNAYKNCWDACGYAPMYGSHQGKCGWCGADGWCCRRDHSGNGCDGKFGGYHNHACVLKPGTLKNSGKNCWDGCNEQEGKCDWCGTEGFCCKKDSIGNGCDGVFGGQDNHECVRKYGKNLFGCYDNETCKVSLKTAHNKYVIARPDGSVRNDVDEANDMATFEATLWSGSDKIQFKSAHGKYLIARPNGSFRNDVDEAKDWETFKVEDNGNGKFTFKTVHGKYLIARPDGSVRNDVDKAQDWEAFEVTRM